MLGIITWKKERKKAFTIQFLTNYMVLQFPKKLSLVSGMRPSATMCHLDFIAWEQKQFLRLLVFLAFVNDNIGHQIAVSEKLFYVLDSL